MTNELLPCPFCGSEDIEFRLGITFAGAIHCNNCTADVVFHATANYVDRERELNWQETHAAAWNKRADELEHGE